MRSEVLGRILIMRNDTHDIRVSARTAQLLASDPGGQDNGPPYTFSGVAVAAGDILHMDDGTPVLFTAEELRAAAETQAGEPLTKDHPSDDQGRPQYPPPTDDTIGQVPKAGWLEDVQGVGYQADTHDENVAKGVQAGSYQISVHPTFELGEKDEETGAYTATNIRFKDLSVVSKGDSPSNTAEWGPNHALASYTKSGDLEGDLSASDADADGDGGLGDIDDQEGLIATAVQGALQAVGIGDASAATASTDGGNEPAESGADDDSSADSPMDPDSIIKTLVDEHDFSEESLEAMTDDDLERLYESLVEGDTDDDGGSSTDPAGGDAGADTTTDGDANTVEVDIGDYDGFDEFVADKVKQAEASAQKEEKVEEIIAKSDDYSEEDHEDLLAASSKIVDREHQRVRGELAAGLPGAAGAASQLTADAVGASDSSDDDVDAYGTGVQED